MRGNLKALPEEPQYVEAKLSCIEFQETKKLLFQVKTLVTSFGLPCILAFKSGLGFMKPAIFRHSRKLNWEHGWRSPWNRMSLRTRRHDSVVWDEGEVINAFLKALVCVIFINRPSCVKIAFCPRVYPSSFV